MRPVDIPLAGPLLDQERTGIVLHDLDGGAVAEAAHLRAVCKRDRDGARDLRGRSSLAALFRCQCAWSYARTVGHAGGRPAESKRGGSDEAGQDVTLASAPYSATGTERELPRTVASVSRVKGFASRGRRGRKRGCSTRTLRARESNQWVEFGCTTRGQI